MAVVPGTFDALHRRRALYSYLRPLLEGRRVLEIGAPDGDEHLRGLGVRSLTSAGDPRAALDRALSAGPFEVVLVPEATSLARGSANPGIPALRGLLASGGRLVCAAANGDRQGSDGVGYYDLLDALAPHFARVRMLGQTPFAAFGVAEFDEAAGGLRVDSGLVDESAEQPTYYIAIGGPDEALALGYALVQTPIAAAAAAAPADDTAELRRLLSEAQGRADGAVRVSRAQTEELEELRARLRRAAEAREELDAEAARLRRALTEADASVLDLTRRTTEISALAKRMTAGLRGDSGAGEGVRDLQTALAARESALAERDDRVAALEAERQDLAWRLDEAEERLRRAGGAESRGERRALSDADHRGGGRGPSEGPQDDDLIATLRMREQALEEYRRAAQAHVDEVSRLRDALMDQSTLVAELEEALLAAEGRAAVAEQEAERLRRAIADAEDADRQRRSRLAELEGTLLRMQRQAAVAQPQPGREGDTQGLQRRVSELEAEAGQLRARLADAEQARVEVERRWEDAAGNIVGLERAAAERDEQAQSAEALRARIDELEAKQDSSRVTAALAEVDRLRGALRRSEEQLWDARGRLLADRERIEALERAAAKNAANGPAQVLARVLEEVSALEQGLLAEAAQLASAERALAEWRAALGNGNGTTSEAARSTDS